jgi:hypothetical protein
MSNQEHRATLKDEILANPKELELSVELIDNLAIVIHGEVQKYVPMSVSS